jgi:hypothetical protein
MCCPGLDEQMLFKYFHDAVLSGHLGARKTLQRIATNFWWPKTRADIFDYVRCCDLCQRAKSAQDTRVRLHSADPSSQPMEKLFIDFVGPLVRSKRGDIAILVILNAFSKFVSFCPVRNFIPSGVGLFRKGVFSGLRYARLYCN